MTQDLGAYVIFTSSYYPQGNGMNEAAHNSLNRSLAIAEGDLNNEFDDSLRDAVLVYNATPMSMQASSPFCALFGFEPILPGWQHLAQRVNERIRRATQTESRQRAMVLSEFCEKQRQKCEADKEIREGDWVLHVLSNYERRAVTKARVVSEDQESSLK